MAANMIDLDDMTKEAKIVLTVHLMKELGIWEVMNEDENLMHRIDMVVEKYKEVHDKPEQARKFI